MAKTNYKTVDEYIALFPLETKQILETLRQAIRKEIPKVEEAISYQIPVFKSAGNYIIYFAGWKKHISLYPIPTGNASFQKEIKPFVKGKGTLQFQLDEPLPLSLISKVVRLSVKEREKKKLYAKK